jgi:mono/diheme cytochrome c family protein
MKTKISSTTLNSSTAFSVPSFQTANELGWSAMPAFPVTLETQELGWSAMPAFGKSGAGSENTEKVADFVRQTTSPVSEKSVLKSFWGALGLRD